MSGKIEELTDSYETQVEAQHLPEKVAKQPSVDVAETVLKHPIGFGVKYATRTFHKTEVGYLEDVM
mgnify:CR=1 FL=1